MCASEVGHNAEYVHDTPMVSSDDRMHVMDRTCWCKPEVLRQPSGDDLIVHNEVTWDNEEAAQRDGPEVHQTVLKHTGQEYQDYGR